MDIKDLKQLKALIKLCRSEGVKTISVDGISLELNEKPVKYQALIKSKLISDPGISFPPNVDESIKIPQMLDIPTDELSQEDLLFYSAEQQGS